MNKGEVKKDCRKCKNYEPSYQCNRPDEPEEYDGDSCLLVSRYRSYSDKVPDSFKNMYKLLAFLEETYLFEDMDGSGGEFIGMVCPAFDFKTIKPKRESYNIQGRIFKAGAGKTKQELKLEIETRKQNLTNMNCSEKIYKFNKRRLEYLEKRLEKGHFRHLGFKKSEKRQYVEPKYGINGMNQFKTKSR